jgi:hypothetical protein
MIDCKFLSAPHGVCSPEKGNPEKNRTHCENSQGYYAELAHRQKNRDSTSDG